MVKNLMFNLMLTFIFLCVLYRVKRKKLVIFGVTAFVFVAVFIAIIIIFITRNSQFVDCDSKFRSSSKLGRYKKVILIK